MKDLRRLLTTYASMFIGAFLLAYFLSKTPIGFIIVFVLSFTLVASLYHLVVRILVGIASRDPIIKAIRNLEEEIARLPVENVKAEAEQLLKDSSRFSCSKATKSLPGFIQSLGSHLVDVFGKYKSIRTVQGQVVLGWDEVGISDLNPEYVRIGKDEEFFTEIVVRKGEETIYVIDGSEKSKGDIEQDRYSTIYHWILYTGKSLCRHE